MVCGGWRSFVTLHFYQLLISVYFIRTNMNIMKLIAAFASMVLTAGMIWAQDLPDVSVENMDGETVSIRDVVRGKPAVISFWGVTCKPCITELNALNEVMEEWLEDVDFDIIAVSVDDSRFSSRARSMAQGYDWQFKSVFDKNQDLKRAMNVSLTPQTFIVDASGNIVYSHSGYTPGSEYELYDKLMEISE